MKIRLNKLFYLWIISLSIPNIIWIFLNKSVWPWDQAWYGEVTFLLWSHKSIGLQYWLDSILSAFQTKAPLIAWVGQFFLPLSDIIENPETLLLLYINVINVITILLVCSAGHTFLEKNHLNRSLVTSLAISGSPLFMAMSHEYFVEPLQGLAVAYSLWLWAQMYQGMCRVKSAIHIIFLLSIAVASKSTTPVYMIVPGIAIICEFAKSNKIVNTTKYLLVLPLPFFLIIITWYYKNWDSILNFAIASSSGAVALNYGADISFIAKIEYWSRAISQSLAMPIIFNLVTLIVIISLIINKVKKLDDKLILLLIIQIIIILILLSLNINQETRYLFPLIPIFGLIIYFLIPNNKYVFIGLFFIFVIQYIYVVGVSLHLIKPNYNLINHWLKPYVISNKEHNELKRAVNWACNQGESHLVIVGVEYPEFNANSMAFIAAQNKLKCKFTSLGYAAKDFNETNLRFKKLKPSSFITINVSCQKPNVDFLNELSENFSKNISLNHPNCKLENKTAEGCINEYRCQW